jgi:hypothetical protein
MSNIVFEPWIGSRYKHNNRFGVRILVLGESHYGEETETRPTATTDVVRRYAQRERYPFFTKVSKVLLGLDSETWLDNRARGDVWEDIAFYNYIQGFVSEDSRVRPSAEMWSAAKAPFLQMLKDLDPNVVLVLGKELGAHLPPIPERIEVCCIQHPSTGFSYAKWNPLFSEAVRRARAKA